MIGCDTIETLRALKREFGAGLKQFLINMGVKTPAEAEKILQAASD